MATSNFTSTFIVDNSAEDVFNAINNVRGWWSEEIDGNTGKLNEEWTYHFQDVHICKMKIIEFVPNQKVAWQVMENYFSFTKNKKEWTGNKIIFEIIEKENKTQINFTQIGLIPEYECYDICENAWNTYIQRSLFNLITTGKGEPNGKDQPQTEDEKAISSSNFTTTFFVNQKPPEVFKAINNVRGWWQGEIKGNTEKVNDEFSYQMKEVHFSKQKIVEFIPNEKVVWLVTDSKLNFDNQGEWTGTKIIFEITEINNKTQIRFTHFGLIPTFECYGGCSWAWGELMQQSLFSLITTSKGTNVFR
ncbi:MAG: SRPBCC family protein [Chitinophagaceae bacterium]